MPTKKTPARKTAAKKPAAKATVKKPASAPKPTPGSKEDKLATSALKLIDQAAGLLRKGVVTGAGTTEKARTEAKHRAHSILTEATSALHKLISKV